LPKISLEIGLAVGGLVLTIVLVVLDKAGKLKGPVLYWLLVVAALMTLPLVLGNSLIVEVSSSWKYWLRAFVVSTVVFCYWAIGIWISPASAKSGSSQPREALEGPSTSTPKKPEAPPTTAENQSRRNNSAVHRQPDNTEPNTSPPHATPRRAPPGSSTPTSVTYEVRPFQSDSEGHHRILVLISASIPLHKPGLVVVCDRPILNGTISSSAGFLASTGRMTGTTNNVFMFGVSMPETIEPGIQLEVLLSADGEIHVQGVEQFLLAPIPPKD